MISVASVGAERFSDANLLVIVLLGSQLTDSHQTMLIFEKVLSVLVHDLLTFSHLVVTKTRTAQETQLNLRSHQRPSPHYPLPYFHKMSNPHHLAAAHDATVTYGSLIDICFPETSCP